MEGKIKHYHKDTDLHQEKKKKALLMSPEKLNTVQIDDRICHILVISKFSVSNLFNCLVIQSSHNARCSGLRWPHPCNKHPWKVRCQARIWVKPGP